MQVTLDAPASPRPAALPLVAGCKNQSSADSKPSKKCFWANGFTPEWLVPAAESEKLDADHTGPRQ